MVPWTYKASNSNSNLNFLTFSLSWHKSVSFCKRDFFTSRGNIILNCYSKKEKVNSFCMVYHKKIYLKGIQWHNCLNINLS